MRTARARHAAPLERRLHRSAFITVASMPIYSGRASMPLAAPDSPRRCCRAIRSELGTASTALLCVGSDAVDRDGNRCRGLRAINARRNLQKHPAYFRAED